MESTLKKTLQELTLTERIELTSALKYAGNLREALSSRSIDTARFSKETSIDIKEVEQLLNGTHRYDLKTISIINAYFDFIDLPQNSQPKTKEPLHPKGIALSDVLRYKDRYPNKTCQEIIDFFIEDGHSKHIVHFLVDKAESIDWNTDNINK